MTNIIAIAERWARKPGRRGSHRKLHSRSSRPPRRINSGIQSEALGKQFTPAFRAALKRVSRDWRVNQVSFAETAIHFWSETVDQHSARELAKQAARKMTGLTQRDISRLENAGLDYSAGQKAGGVTGEKLRHFDSIAQEAARLLPELGLGDPDDHSANFSERLWAVLAEGRQSQPVQQDQTLLVSAARYVQSVESRQESNACDTCDVPF